MPPPCCSVSAASRKAPKMPDIESAIVPITKQLNSVTDRDVPAPARMRPAGRNLWPASAPANSSAHSRRRAGASALAAASATRAKLSATLRSTGVPSGCLSRYFMSQIWRAISLMAASIRSFYVSLPQKTRLALKRAFAGQDFAPFGHQFRRRALDAVLQGGHELRPLQAGRNRLEEFHHDLAGLFDDAQRPRPEQSRIERHRHARHVELAIERGDPRLVVGRGAGILARAFRKDHHGMAARHRRARLRRHLAQH